MPNRSFFYCSRLGALACLAFVLMFLVAQPARADFDDYPCDPKVKADIDAARANAAAAKQQEIDKIFGQPNSFESLYCGANITSNFQSLASMLTSGVSGLIKNFLKGLMNQACQAAIAPLQNAASLACIPRIDMSFSLGNLFSSGSRGFCDGFQLINVSPTTSAPASSSGGLSPYVPLAF